jgi:hypothetical protein
MDTNVWLWKLDSQLCDTKSSSSHRKREKIMNIAILLYEGVTALDAIGPYEVLASMPDAKVYFVAKNPGSSRPTPVYPACMPTSPCLTFRPRTFFCCRVALIHPT